MADAPLLRLGGRELRPSPRQPLVMGIVNASPDSFSDAGGTGGIEAQVELGLRLLADGADLLDVGGETGRTDRDAVGAEVEVERVVPVIEALSREGALVGVDTWRAEVAEAALAAGAVLVNDVSALRDPRLAEVAADAGAGMVLTHTRVPPKVKAFPGYGDVVEDVVELLRELLEQAVAAGVERDRVVLDPGPDLAKSPAETVTLLRELGRVVGALGRPVLLAVSRKDFVGALGGRAPARRLGGTLAAIGAGLDAGGSIIRAHDVAEVCEYLTVRAALRGERDVPDDLALSPELRHEPERE